MSISPFFLQLRTAYQAEIDDLTFDSEGRNVLGQRLTAKRKEMGFLVQMMQLSPEMVAVVFHQGFEFKQPGVMHDLLAHESDALPEWSRLADALVLTPQAQTLSQAVLKEPLGAWFLTVAAALEFMYHQPDARPAAADADDEEGHDHDGERDHDHEGGGKSSDPAGGRDGDDERDERAREEAGADWLAQQGFDRKE